MKDEMLDHGLEEPRYATKDGWFEVILTGPGENLDQLRVPEGEIKPIVEPSVEQKLNERQKAIIQHVLETGSVASGWCRTELKVTYDTANRDLRELAELAILKREGKGRATRYVLRSE